VSEPLIVVVSGPGGVGKSTIVGQLVQRDPRLWLSRSWTTRERRQSESDDAYVFIDRHTFERRVAEGGFLEWTEFLGNLYGTPEPEPPVERDIVLEIEVDGAQQVKRRHPGALMLFVLPPTRSEQEVRLHRRGDPEHKVAERLRKAEEEEPVGRSIADHVIVNSDLSATVDEMLDLIRLARGSRTVG
jgi:guanylate kinase